MNENIEAVISKIQKLLALSKSANANEAAASAAIANKLIDQYRLSAEDLIDSTDGVIEDAGYIYESGRIITWKSILINILIKHYGCACFDDCDYSTGRKVSRFKLVGRPSDITIVKYMFNWLASECLRLSSLNSRGRGKTFTNSYCNGFVVGIYEQLQKSRQEVINQTGVNATTALATFDTRLVKANEVMNKNHKLREVKTNVSGRYNADAYHSGMQQGKNMHLGASMGTGSTKLLGS